MIKYKKIILMILYVNIIQYQYVHMNYFQKVYMIKDNVNKDMIIYLNNNFINNLIYKNYKEKNNI